MTEQATGRYCCGVLTLSDKGAAGLREDTSGPAIRAMLEQAGFCVDEYRVIADEFDLICTTLRQWADRGGLHLIVTTGGTGVSPRDVTPEATAAVCQRMVPGIGERMRAASMAITPHAMLSRGVSGIRKQCLIVNLPGSQKAATENLEAVLPALPHAIDKILGSEADCGG